MGIKKDEAIGSTAFTDIYLNGLDRKMMMIEFDSWERLRLNKMQRFADLNAILEAKVSAHGLKLVMGVNNIHVGGSVPGELLAQLLADTEPFLKEYVKEVVFAPGYPNGPPEQETMLLTAYITRTDR